VKLLVTLSAAELQTAAHGGVDRRVSAIEHNRQGRSHEQVADEHQNWWQTTVIGAIGEYAVAKAFGRVWDPTVGRVNAPADVSRYQVRSTESKQPMLRVRTGDDPDQLYILAQVWRNMALLHGYLPGHQVVSWGNDYYGGVWSVGADLLYSMADLPEEIDYSDTVRPYKRTTITT